MEGRSESASRARPAEYDDVGAQKVSTTAYDKLYVALRIKIVQKPTAGDVPLSRKQYAGKRLRRF